MPVDFPFDELNILKQMLFEARKLPDTDEKRGIVDKLLDDVEEMLEMDYMYGVMDARNGIGISIDPDMKEAQGIIFEKFDGKDFRQRLTEYLYTGTDYDIARVIDTDMHRVYNGGLYHSGKRAGATTKTWHTVDDLRVRDTHDYLDGITVGIDDEFYTYNGDSTYYPGQFGIAEQDINCRCWLTIG